MNLIILDFLKRYVWLYLLSLVLHIATTYYFWSQNFSQFLITVLPSSALVLLLDRWRLGSLHLGFFLRLPVTRKQIVNAWRVIGLVIPGVLFSVGLIISFLLSSVFKEDILSVDKLLHTLLVQALYLGAIFFGFTIIATQGEPGLSKSNFGNSLSLFAAIMMIQSPFLLPLLVEYVPGYQRFDSSADLSVSHCLGYGIGLVITIVGYLRASKLLHRKPKLKQVSSWVSQGQAQKIRGSEGLVYLAKRMALPAIVFGVILIVISIGMKVFSDGRINILQDSFFIRYTPVVITMCIVQVFPMLRQIGSMPISRIHISLLLVVMPLFFTFLIQLFTLYMGSQMSEGIDLLNGMVQVLASGSLVMLVIPLMLRFGINICSIVTLFAVIMLVQAPEILNMFDRDSLNARWFEFPAIFFGLPLAWFLTYKALQTAHPWKVNAFKVYQAK